MSENSKLLRRVILESPYSARTFWGRYQNKKYARACMADSLKRGEAPLASHLLYTQPGILRDHVPEERRRGIDAGLAWGPQADATVVYIDRGVSLGMKYGVMLAKREQRSIEYRSLHRDVHNRWDESWGDPRHP